MDQQLMDAFDPSNKEIMENIERDLKETSIIMKRLALRHVGHHGIFRPLHAICPKLSYRSGTQSNELGMSVVASSAQFDYVKLKIIDIEQPELSEMNVYMTPQQLCEHTTTYFRYAVSMQQKTESKRKCHSHCTIQPSLHPKGAYTPSQIHQYVKRNKWRKRY